MTPEWSREVAETFQAPAVRSLTGTARQSLIDAVAVVEKASSLRGAPAELWAKATDQIERLTTGKVTLDELLAAPFDPAAVLDPSQAPVPQPHPLAHPHSAVTAAATPAEKQDDNRKWGALPLATAAASVDPAAVYDPTWWRRAYARNVGHRVGTFGTEVARLTAEELGVDFDPEDPAFVDALDGLDDAADDWGAGLGPFVEGQVRAGLAEGDTVGGLVSRLRDSEDSWFGTGRSVLLAAVAAATTYNRATLASATTARAQGTSSTKTWTCVLPETRLAALGATHAARCWYRGRVARLLSVSGAELRLTAEHPVLTPRGWVRADELNPGDQLVRYLGGDRTVASAHPYVADQPPTAFEVFEAAHQRRPAERVMGAAVDLDRNGERSEVDVVAVDGLLRNSLQASLGEEAAEHLLTLSDLDLEALLRESHRGQLRLRSSASGGRRDSAADALALGFVAGADAPGSALRPNPGAVGVEGYPDGVHGASVALGERPEGCAGFVLGDDLADVRGEWGLSGGALAFGGDGGGVPGLRSPVVVDPAAGTLRPGAKLDACLAEASGDGCAVRSERLRHLGERLAGLVELDDLVEVQVDPYEGWVHDLTTVGHWFVADSIIVHNCVGDDRVRDTHVDMDGQSVDVGDDFLVAGAYPAAGPHDERLPVEETANCRCWVEISGDGGNVQDETTSVDDGDVTYETDGSEEDALVAGAEFHTHGHCERCGGWLEGRSYCAKCGRGYSGPLLEAGGEPPDDDPSYNRPSPSGTMPGNEDVGQVAADGVDQEDAVPMPTTAPAAAASSGTITVTGGDQLAELVQRFQTADQSAQLATTGIGMVPWRGVLAVEGRATGDGRMFRQGALYWDDGFLPTDLFAMLQDPDGGVGHDGSSICGRIDRMWKAPAEDGSYTEVWGEGIYDTATPTGAEVFRLQQNGMLTGVSVDVDSVAVVMPEIASDEDLLDLLFGGGVEEYSSGRIRRATVCSIPAFIEARIFPVSDVGALVASAASEGFAELRVWTPLESTPTERTTLVASASAFPAQPKAKEADVFHSALVDADPPAEVFARQEYRTFTPYEVDAEGRIHGHVSPWGECHIGFSDRCVTAPRSRTGYLHARTGRTLTAEGDIVATARVYAQFGHGRAHAPEELAAAPAVEWYENQTLAVADVAIFEDAHGIQIQGRVRPGATRAQVVALRCSRISPDWRSIGGALECVGLAVVNVSGFTNSSRLPALVASAIEAGVGLPDLDADLFGSAFLADGQVLTLVASGGPTRDPSLALVGVVQKMAERLEALEQAELARQAAALLAGLPTVEEEQAALSAEIARVLDGVDLDEGAAVIEAAASTEEPTIAGLSADELDTLRAALAITERLSARPMDEDLADGGDTMKCPHCGEDIPADSADAGDGTCPECGWNLGKGSSNVADAVVASSGCGCGGSCATCTVEAPVSA